MNSGCIFFFFFSSRRRHPRFSRDWSSDVCSSDLAADDDPLAQRLAVVLPRQVGIAGQIGRASCRERVEISVVAVSLKKKNRARSRGDEARPTARRNTTTPLSRANGTNSALFRAGKVFSIALMLFFFFQAEDGIRDFHVTGVQTCALPI